LSLQALRQLPKLDVAGSSPVARSGNLSDTRVSRVQPTLEGQPTEGKLKSLAKVQVGKGPKRVAFVPPNAP